MRIRFGLCWLIAVMFFGQVVSCSGLSPANKSLYCLDAGRPTASESSQAQQITPVPAGIPREQVLQVRRVNIAPPFDGPSLVYRPPGGTYVKDYYSEWVSAPEELFTTQMVDWLSTSGPFASVVDGRSAAPHQFVLETCITSLYGDFQQPTEPKVVLTARVYLLGDRAVAFQNHYDISIPIADASAQQMVVGSGRAYRQLLESITQDLAAARKTVALIDQR
jgi:uncharacterized lipoprotein YmbA